MAKDSRVTVLEILLRGGKTRSFLKLRDDSLLEQASMLIGARGEGFLAGKTEGKREGKVEVAVNLLNLGVDVPTISKSTGLTKEEIKGLK